MVTMQCLNCPQFLELLSTQPAAFVSERNYFYKRLETPAWISGSFYRLRKVESIIQEINSVIGTFATGPKKHIQDLFLSRNLINITYISLRSNDGLFSFSRHT